MATAALIPGFLNALPEAASVNPREGWREAPVENRAVRKSRALDSDTLLVERCIGGDSAAWEELVRLHTRRVYSLCYRFTGKDAEAQDLTQEVFLRIFRTVKSFRVDEGSFSTWTARVTRNLLIDHYRRTRQDRSTDSIEDQLPRIEAAPHQEMRPDALVSGREKEELLRVALNKLSPELRETVILRDLQELEYREIAEILRIPEGTVKSRLNRGRAELARLLRKQRTAL
jgi:RNA polymerase sigma-70 factor (ECF subfamily)